MTGWLQETIMFAREIIEEIRMTDPSVDAVCIKDYVAVDQNGVPTTNGDEADDTIGGTAMAYFIRRNNDDEPIRFPYALQKRQSSTAEVPTGSRISGEQDYDIVLPYGVLVPKTSRICIVDADNNTLRTFEVIELYDTTTPMTLRIALRESGK